MIRRISVAAALTAALVMSGCGGDRPSGDPSGTPTTASSSPTPTVTGPVAPVLPEAAKVNDDAGAKAFVEYWFAAVTYAMQTGDTKPFMAVSAEECKSCAGLERRIRAIYDGGGKNLGGGWLPDRIEMDPSSTATEFRFVARVVQPQQALVDGSGATSTPTPEQTFAFYVGVALRQGAFLLTGVQDLESAQ